MRKILLSFIFVFLLSACQSSTYIVVSEEPVDGYYIYHKEQKGFLCNSYWEDIYYSGEIYNYGYRFKGCGPSMSYFIEYGDTGYLYLREALDRNIITLESLIPELMELERNPEEIESDDADYYWLDFHIDGNVVYAYAGGECDQSGTETFIINNKTYIYSASGCLKSNILYMRIDGENTTIASLIDIGEIDPIYLIPLLTEDEN